MVKNVIVSNRLPIQVTKLENSFQITPSSGGLATGVNSIRDESSVWIGWSGIKSEDFTDESKLEIDKALIRIKDDTYGYCLDTAEPIGLKRLMARPVAKYTIAAQEKHEKNEKVHADD